MSKRVAPILPVRELQVALEYYRALGFRTRSWSGGGYGFLDPDGNIVPVRLPPEPGLTRPDPGRSSARLIED